MKESINKFERLLHPQKSINLKGLEHSDYLNFSKVNVCIYVFIFIFVRFERTCAWFMKLISIFAINTKIKVHNICLIVLLLQAKYSGVNKSQMPPPQITSVTTATTEPNQSEKVLLGIQHRGGISPKEATRQLRKFWPKNIIKYVEVKRRKDSETPAPGYKSLWIIVRFKYETLSA